jgi:hypothetical protein
MAWRSQETHIWGCYVGKSKMGRTALGNRIHMHITMLTVLKNSKSGIYQYEDE